MRIVLVALLTLLIGYASLCGWMYWRQRDLIYYAAATRADARDTDFALQRPDATLRGWVSNHGRTRALLYFGGNAESIQWQRDALARAFPQHTIYLLAYRGYGASDGAPSEVALTADALALFDAVQARHAEIDAIGRSLGSGVAVQLAAQRPVARLVLVTPYDSIARVAADAFPWLPVDWLLQDRYESWRHAVRVRVPVLVLTAAEDRVIAAGRSTALAAAFPLAPRQVRIAAADHDSIDAQPEYLGALRDFLRRDE
jgi:uncharacterized protein